MTEDGELEKLLIKAYDNPKYSGDALGTFTSYVNPSEITLSYETEYDSAQGAGTTNSRMNFKKMKPGDLSVALFLDGTGANGQPLNVQKKIEEFQTVTGYNGKIHRPNYLKLVWGKLQVRRCVLRNASIAYKVFTSKGVPLRAVITASFSDNSDDNTRVAIAQDQSADLTHRRLVKAGDTLPGLCHQIYGDPRYYIQVAEFNRLLSFRELKPGIRLTFPPLPFGAPPK